MAYMQGSGHQHFGPGTSMVQFVQPSHYYGMAGAATDVPCGSVAETVACCDSCAHGGSCGKGLLDRGGLGCACDKRGMGLFDSGADFTQWGAVEWGIVLLGGYMVVSTVFTTKRAVSRVRALPDDVRAGVKRGRRRLGAKVAGA